MPVGKWLDVGTVDQIEPGTARTLPVEGRAGQFRGELAVFRTMRGEVFTVVNKCPHKQGPLSQGIVHGNVVTCPLHNWNISLETGRALGDDDGCVPMIPTKVEGGRIFLLREAVLNPQVADAVDEASKAAA